MVTLPDARAPGRKLLRVTFPASNDRELVYTGITRARDWLIVVETESGMLDEAVTREVMRGSGLGRL